MQYANPKYTIVRPVYSIFPNKVRLTNVLITPYNLLFVLQN